MRLTLNVCAAAAASVTPTPACVQETRVSPMVMEAALKRDGVWFVDPMGYPTNFYHRACFMAMSIEERVDNFRKTGLL
jgi:hypothetical protein